MMYFIRSVTTYQATGKTKKGKVLQNIAGSFLNNVFRDRNALFALVTSLRNVVENLNKLYPGATLKVEWLEGSDYIGVRYLDNPEKIIFSIYYSPIMGDICAANVRCRITDILVDWGDDKLKYCLYKDEEKR